jgi:multidrug resistance efflux pump
MTIEIVHVVAVVGALAAAVGILWRCYYSTKETEVAMLREDVARLLGEVTLLKQEVHDQHAIIAKLLTKVPHDDPEIREILDSLSRKAV